MKDRVRITTSFKFDSCCAPITKDYLTVRVSIYLSICDLRCNGNGMSAAAGTQTKAQYL
jgi:hypothetical protein